MEARGRNPPFVAPTTRAGTVAAGRIASVGSTMSTANGLRLDNTVLYQTPDLSGSMAGALYSFNAVGWPRGRCQW